MSKPQLIVNGPRGRILTNAEPDAEMEAAFDMLAEKLAPMVAKLLEEPATNGSNGRRITDAYQPPADDHWAGYDMNEPIGDEPPRYTPTGDDLDGLPD